jgi:gamma-glutamylcyclotransferase
MDGIEFYYFAYGSNLPFLRMLERSSKDLKLLDKFAWTDRRLAFAKKSHDGSGKCTVLAASDKDVVWGVIYQLTREDKLKLDRHEVGYHEASLRVSLNGVQTPAFTYIADPKLIDQSLRPYQWYKRYVVAGAREHGFPSEYIDAIDRVESMHDPDAARHAHHEACLVPIEKAPQSGIAKR